MADSSPDEETVPDADETAEDVELERDPSVESTPPSADDDGDDEIGIVDARERAMEVADQLLEHPIEGVVRIEGANDGGWRVLVEALERSAVPDTQDIIGRYEFVVDASGSLGEYGLVERYRRGEMKEEL